MEVVLSFILFIWSSMNSSLSSFFFTFTSICSSFWVVYFSKWVTLFLSFLYFSIDLSMPCFISSMRALSQTIIWSLSLVCYSMELSWLPFTFISSVSFFNLSERFFLVSPNDLRKFSDFCSMFYSCYSISAFTWSSFLLKFLFYSSCSACFRSNSLQINSSSSCFKTTD